MLGANRQHRHTTYTQAVIFSRVRVCLCPPVCMCICAHVNAGSDSSGDCECIAGYTGPNGGPCTACEEGKYKEASGGGSCTSCPSHSESPAGATCAGMYYIYAVRRMICSNVLYDIAHVLPMPCRLPVAPSSVAIAQMRMLI